MTRKLDRLNGSNSSGIPFKQLWQRNCEAVEENFDDQQSQLTAITALQSQMLDRIAEIEAAQAAADAAQGTANTAKTNDAISSSWTSPGSILSAADAGSDVTVTIADHTRKYGDATSVPVTGSTITGLAYTTTYYIYYDDASRAGGAVAYNATTNPNTALANAATGRHFCGEVPTPAAGAPPSTGGVSPPSGGGGIPDTDVP